MKTFCTECGNENMSEAKFCGNCGEEIKNKILKEIDNDNESEILFYYIKPWKFILLSIFSLGLFNIIWFYKNWSALKFYDNEYKQLNISPFLRAWFGVFTSFELFPKILNSAKKLGYKGNYPGKFLGFLYLFSSLIIRILDKINFSGQSMWTLYFVLFIFSPFIFIPVLNAIKFNNSKIKVQTKMTNKLSIGQIIFTIFGILIFFFYLGSGFMEGLKISNPEYIKQIVAEVKKKTSFPTIIDENTTWLNIEAENNAIKYDYSFYGIDTSNLSVFSLKNILLEDACKNFKESFLSRGIDIQYSYTNIDTGENYFVTITNNDCN